MRTLIARLIYRKWFYAFLALVLWFDSWTDAAGLWRNGFSVREAASLALSLIGAVLVTVVFMDLHWRWPPET